jgi:hypothetical protein
MHCSSARRRRAVRKFTLLRHRPPELMMRRSGIDLGENDVLPRLPIAERAYWGTRNLKTPNISEDIIKSFNVGKFYKVSKRAFQNLPKQLFYHIGMNIAYDSR